MASLEKIQADFDRLAVLSTEEWNHNDYYHSFLLRHVPSPCAQALDIGCGTGGFSRLLAQRSQHVVALDLSPQMIHVAQERSTRFNNIEYQVADVLQRELPAHQFDCVVSIATLHHLPLELMLEKMKVALKANGVLLVLDLFKAESAADYAPSIPAIPWNFALRLWKEHRLRSPREVRAAWAEHGRTDLYLTLSQVRQSCTRFYRALVSHGICCGGIRLFGLSSPDRLLELRDRLASLTDDRIISVPHELMGGQPCRRSSSSKDRL